MKQLDVDTDNNGKTDTWTYLDGTRIERIEIDRDENGMIERWEYYLDNKLEKIGSSSRGDGIVDEWAFQNPEGSLARVETDTNRDGRVDKWETFDPPSTAGGAAVLRSVGRDVDNIGRPTQRLIYRPDGSFERLETLPR